MDAYPWEVQTKGGYVQFNPEWVVFTSNYSPMKWYSKKMLNPFDKEAFFERVEFEIFVGKHQYFMVRGDAPPFPGLRQQLGQIVGEPDERRSLLDDVDAYTARRTQIN